MEFTVGNDTRKWVAPQEIRQAWRGQTANMVHSYNSEEQSFLELFDVRFSVLISNFLRMDYWIPQAYSSSESEERLWL